MGCTAYIKLTNWPTDQSVRHFLREFEALDEARKCLKESLEMFWNWGVDVHEILPPFGRLNDTAWWFYRFFHHVIQNGTKCSEGSREHKGDVSTWMHSDPSLRSGWQSRLRSGWHGGDSLWMTRQGRGLVGWSVGQFLCTHLSFRSLGNEEKWVYSKYPIDKKNKWW